MGQPERVEQLDSAPVFLNYCNTDVKYQHLHTGDTPQFYRYTHILLRMFTIGSGYKFPYIPFFNIVN